MTTKEHATISMAIGHCLDFIEGIASQVAVIERGQNGDSVVCAYREVINARESLKNARAHLAYASKEGDK